MTDFLYRSCIQSKVYNHKWLRNDRTELKIALVRSFCFGILWIIFSPSFGQLPEFSSTWSKDTLYFKASQPEVVGMDTVGGFYVVKSSAKGGIPDVLEHYDKKLHLSNSLNLRKKDKSNKGKIEKVVQLNGVLQAIYSRVDKRRKKITLYARVLNDKTLQPDRNKKILCEFDFKGHNVSKNERFAFVFSGDSSKILMLCNFSKIGDNQDYYSCILLDDKLNLVWQKMMEFPYPRERFEIHNIKLNNQGNVFILGKTGIVYDLLLLISNADSLVRYPISLSGHQVTSAQIELVNDNLFCAGFYSDTGLQNVKGTYFLSINPSFQNIKSEISDEFDLKFILKDLTEFDSNWTRQNGDRGEAAELYRYSLDKIWVKKDGGIFLIGEQRFGYANTQMAGEPVTRMDNPMGVSVARTSRYAATDYTNKTSSLARNSTERNYHYVANDILVVKLDSTGHMQWSSKIHKSQNTLGDDGFYSSFLIGVLHQKLCFLFNDNTRNMNEKWLKRPRDFTGRKSTVVMISLTEDGEPIRNWIYETAEREVRVIPKMSRWLSPSQLILFGRREEFQQLGLVKFK